MTESDLIKDLEDIQTEIRKIDPYFDENMSYISLNVLCSELNELSQLTTGQPSRLSELLTRVAPYIAYPLAEVQSMLMDRLFNAALKMDKTAFYELNEFCSDVAKSILINLAFGVREESEWHKIVNCCRTKYRVKMAVLDDE